MTRKEAEQHAANAELALELNVPNWRRWCEGEAHAGRCISRRGSREEQPCAKGAEVALHAVNEEAA